MKPVPFPSTIVAVLGLSAALWGCEQDDLTSEAPSTQEVEQTEQPDASGMQGALPDAGGMMEQLRAGCPMIVPGDDVSVFNTDEGVTLAITTETGDIDDLRRRVRHMAQMYEMHRGQHGRMWHHMGDGAMGHGRGMGPGHMSDQAGSKGPGMGAVHMRAQGTMPVVTATVTETNKGARLELRPSDPTQLESLRAHAHWDAKRMHAGQCWMQQEQLQDDNR